MEDNEIQKIWAKLQELQRFQRNQASEQTIAGTTNPTPETAGLFSHTLKRIPDRFFHVQGDVYVYSMKESQVDVRSTKANVNFKIIIS